MTLNFESEAKTLYPRPECLETETEVEAKTNHEAKAKNQNTKAEAETKMLALRAAGVQCCYTQQLHNVNRHDLCANRAGLVLHSRNNKQRPIRLLPMCL